MGEHYPAEDTGAVLLERRWFAARRAASEIQAECDVLARVLCMTQSAWRNARARQAQLEALRDALGDRLSEMIDERELPIPRSAAYELRSESVAAGTRPPAATAARSSGTGHP